MPQRCVVPTALARLSSGDHARRAGPATTLAGPLPRRPEAWSDAHVLTPEERQWFAEEAQETLGLTALRTKVLMAVLDRERYAIREVSRATGIGPEQIRVALEMLIARDLIEVRSLGGRFQGYQAVMGGRLRFLLDAILAHQRGAQTSIRF